MNAEKIRYLRASDQRLLAVKFLVANGSGQFGSEAKYLAGYAVECSLKALLIQRTPAGKIPSIVAKISKGARGHDIERLKEFLRKQGWSVPLALANDFRSLGSWTTDLRYEVRRIPTAEAEAFVASASRLVGAINPLITRR